LLIKLLF